MLKKTLGRSAVVIATLGAAAGLPPTAAATEPAERYNAPGQRHVNVCVRLSSPTAPLRYGDASPTGFGLDNQRTFDDNRCPPGTVRLDLHERIPSPAGPLVFHRGGNGYNDDQNVKYGELATPSIADVLPAPVPSRGGRGASCDLLDVAYRVDVKSIPSAMHYKRPQDLASGSNNGASFMHYGDPASDQGSRHDIHYSYLLWSFVNVRGGGIVRTLLKDDQLIRPCDVAPITMSSWDRAGAVNGQVTARYVRILAGSCPVYGWMVWEHDSLSDGSPAVQHWAAGPATPPTDPARDPACPVQEDAQAPAVTTSGTTALGDTTATLGGTVDPAGAVGSYRFEYGTTAGYGASTPETALGPDIAPLTVTANLTGLVPGTAYHYRLVATNSHGTTYGNDAVLTTTAPPPPERVAQEPAPPPPPPPPPPVVALSEVRVTPATFRRARSRGGSPARIRWNASAPATVTLTFERKALGMRVGSACRAVPRAGLPRRARKCTRWVKVQGSLEQVAESGRFALPFGGWIGRKPLARGTYRVSALPLGDDARAGVARRATFTVR